MPEQAFFKSGLKNRVVISALLKVYCCVDQRAKLLDLYAKTDNKTEQ